MAGIRRMLAVTALLLVAAGWVVAQDPAKPAEGDKPAAEGAKETAKEAAEEGAKKGDGKKVDAAEAPAIKILNKAHITPKMRSAVKKGLKRLAALQDANGAFTKGGGRNVASAVTSLAGLALLASGSTPDKGPYSKQITKAIDYLLGTQDPNNGYFSSANDGSRIHGHGYATLFLAQVYGAQNSNKRLKKALQAAVERIQKGQTSFGGWGYVPDDLTWDEGSTTVCVIQALRAASDAGIVVANKTIQRAIKYLYDTADARPFMVDGVEYKGYTFQYSLASNWNSDSYAICAAAISTMNGIGIYAEGATWKEHDIGKVYKGGLDWLRHKFDNFISRRKKGQSSLDTSHFYYANFYAVQAMWHGPEDYYFDEYFPKMRDLLVEEHEKNATGSGGWPSQSYGEAYTTALALLILQVPYQLLPLYAK